MAAYLAYRAPATFAAAAAVFRQIALQRPEWRPASLLDVGAGPGVAAWAAVEAWPSLTELTLVEAEPEMLAAGRELLPDASWVVGDVLQAQGPADLVVASYVLGELHDPTGAAVHLWRQSADTLALIEPGTPAGYRRVLAARAAAIGEGGQTLGPCPHDLACPLERRRLVPFRGPAAPLEAAPAGQERRARLRGREVLLRGPLTCGRAAGRCADHSPAADPLRPRQPRHLRAGRHPRAHDQPQAWRPLQGGKERRLGRRYR